MTQNIDGVYSVTFAGISGSSLATIRIAEGKLYGNDTGGGWLWGHVEPDGEGVLFRIQIRHMPGVFGVWGGSPSEIPITLSVNAVIPLASVQNAVPFTLHDYGLNMVFTRIPEEFGVLAEEDGLQEFINMLTRLRDLWKGNDRPMP